MYHLVYESIRLTYHLYKCIHQMKSTSICAHTWMRMPQETLPYTETILLPLAPGLAAQVGSRQYTYASFNGL